MCGIVALIAKHPTRGLFSNQTTFFKEMLFVDTLRGSDSTGVFSVDKWGNAKWAKEAVTAESFLQETEPSKIITEVAQKGVFLIGHNRKSTKGATSDNNAHPFHEEHIIMVHNGTILNQKELHATAEVDSHAICHAMVEHGVEEALSKVDGAYAIIAYDGLTKELKVARNKERPLWIGEHEDFYALASEPWMIVGCGWRNHLEFKLKEIDPLKMRVFSLKGIADPIEMTETDVKEYVRPLVVSSSVSYEDEYWGMGWMPNSRYRQAVNEIKDVKEEKSLPTVTDLPAIIKDIGNIFGKSGGVKVDQLQWNRDDIVCFVPEKSNPMAAGGFQIHGYHYNYPDVRVVAADSTLTAAEVIELTAQEILLTDVLTPVVNGSNGKVVLYCACPCASAPYVSLNGLIITEEMVLNLPPCKDCGEIVDEVNVEDSVVKIKQSGAIAHTFCPACCQKNLQKNGKWCNLNEEAKNNALSASK